MSVEGYGMQKDPEQAVYWYRQAANSGHPEAQYFLALLYSSGHGVKKDPEQAERWVSSSAGQGYAPAMADLGKRFATGNGVAKDDKRAYLWLTLAFLHGDKSEEKLRTAEAAKLQPAEVAQQEHAAQNWKPRLASAKPKQ
jgi:TPR repeat protein